MKPPVGKIRWALEGDDLVVRVNIQYLVALVLGAGVDGLETGKGLGALIMGVLTAREKEVLAGIMAGKSNKEIAAALGVAERTCKYHASEIYRKVGVGGRTALLGLAVKVA
jgi:DNA-binding NarL/FixJ family response regulator